MPDAWSAAGSCRLSVYYWEDIDLVQVVAGPIGPVLEEVRAALDELLGAKPRAL